MKSKKQRSPKHLPILLQGLQSRHQNSNSAPPTPAITTATIATIATEQTAKTQLMQASRSKQDKASPQAPELPHHHQLQSYHHRTLLIRVYSEFKKSETVVFWTCKWRNSHSW
jgi:hypothetical protein